MNSEEFKIKLIEQQIYEELKDCPMTGVNYIRNKWQRLDIDYSRLYRKIVNYQVKKYGYSLTIGDQRDNRKSKEEARKITERKNHRKAYQRNYERKKQFAKNVI